MHRGDSRRESWGHVVPGEEYHRGGELQEHHEPGRRSGGGPVGERRWGREETEEVEGA